MASTTDAPCAENDEGAMNGLCGRKITRSGAASPNRLEVQRLGAGTVAHERDRRAVARPDGQIVHAGLVVSSVEPPRARSISHSEDSDGDKARTKTACVPSGEIPMASRRRGQRPASASTERTRLPHPHGEANIVHGRRVAFSSHSSSALLIRQLWFAAWNYWARTMKGNPPVGSERMPLPRTLYEPLGCAAGAAFTLTS
jgi:hypothetical protein